ncbi:10 kDa chaperonin [Achlya hypogyna]|uniref:10 kDa chaperonin n=1 Tax=Achlya hypogyna TaxID=1202772 RepID=A0A1V9YB74_ACHHY|nr:10 kDa chaperonin [Achlya hypogyna]
MSSLRKLLPLGNRVLIKKAEPVLKTAGGIYLPDSAKTTQNEGEVVAVGPGARNHEGTIIPVSVAVGDKVLLPEYGGSVLKLGDDEFHLFRDEDILGKFN